MYAGDAAAAIGDGGGGSTPTEVVLTPNPMYAGADAVPAPVFAVPLDGEIGLAFVGNHGSSGPTAGSNNRPTGKGYVNQNMVARVMAEDEEKQRHARTVPAALLQPSDDTNV